MNRESVIQSAIEFRASLGIESESKLVFADVLLSLASIKLGLAITTLRGGDPLLGGAFAMLDRQSAMIWLDESRSVEERRFSVAHEIGHAVLHTETPPGAFQLSEEINFAGEQSVSSAEGYSPRQRRELETNLWAINLLLPPSAVKRSFVDDHLGASEIAVLIGIPASLVRRQMAESLLRPEFVEAKRNKPIALQSNETPVQLDESQRTAAHVETGPYLLAAGPGTGKTRTLVARCAYLVKERNIRPESILALTFSRKAASEMRERLIAADVGSASSGPWVGTFHAFCKELLERFGHHLGLKQNWRLASDSEIFTLLEKNLVRLHLSELTHLAVPTLHLSDIIGAISRAKDELCTPERYSQLVEEHISECVGGAESDEAKRLREVVQVFPIYQAILRESGWLDYGDLLALSVELLERFPQVRQQINCQYPQVVADEYQDVNFACSRLLRLIAGDQALGLWAVGDRRQSIYRFRGASPANISHFLLDYPNGKQGALTVNYRSAPPIVRLFSDVAAKMSAADSELFIPWIPKRDSGQVLERIRYAIAENAAGQADWIANRMKELAHRNIRYDDQAVLCRTHGQAVLIAEQLVERGIPALYSGELLERSEIKDIVCVLKLFAQPVDRSIIRRIGRILVLQQVEIDQIAKSLKTAEFTGTVAEQILTLAAQGNSSIPKKLVELIVALKPCRIPTEMVERLLFDYSDWMRGFLSQSQESDLNRTVTLGAIRTFLNFLAAKQESYKRDVISVDEPGAEIEGGIDPFTWQIAEIERVGLSGERLFVSANEDSGGNVVKIMTLHASKGLEFPAVFLPNLSKGKFPSSEKSAYIPLPRGLTRNRLIGEAEIEEESCLFFVALSRARDFLYLSRAETYSDSGRQSAVSPFLRLVEDELKRQGVKEEHISSAPTIEYKHAQKTDVSERHKYGDKPAFSASELENYRRCPRQYYYQYVLDYRDLGSNSPHQSYWRTVQTVTSWLQDQWRERKKVTEDELKQKTQQIWTDRKSPPTIYDTLYMEQAEQVLEQTWRYYGSHYADETPVADTTLISELSNCIVRVNADLITVGNHGDLRVVRERNEAPQDDDHRNIRLALIRNAVSHSFKGRESRIELRYNATGDEKMVKADPRYEPGRLQKYVEAAGGIINRNFPPQPENPRSCATCLFRFTCPE